MVGFFKKPMTYLKLLLIILLLVTGYQYRSYSEQAYEGSTTDEKKEGMKKLAFLSGITQALTLTVAIGGFFMIMGR